MSQWKGVEFISVVEWNQSSSSLLTNQWKSATDLGYIHSQELP